MNQQHDFFEDVQQFHKNVNASLIERQQLIHSFEILREKIEDLRIPEEEPELKKQIHRVESLSAVLVDSLISCYETDQDAADSFEYHCLHRKKQEPTSVAPEVSHDINNLSIKESVPH